MSDKKKLIVKKETTENVKKPVVKTDIKTGGMRTGACCDAGTSR